MTGRTVLAAVLLAAGAFAAPSLAAERYWVYFTDRGEAAADFGARVAEARGRLAAQARARRARAGYLVAVDPWDIGPPAAYIAAAEAATGGKAAVVSRWLNAVSIAADADAAANAARLPFVAKVAPVAGWPAPRLSPAARPPEGRDELHGLAYDQLEQIQIIDLHREGYWGDGVTVGVLDTGFNLAHESLAHVRVVAARDFTRQGDWRDDQGGHGTAILSVIGGDAPDRFVGAAPRADYVIAKTELVEPENEVEEDWYVAGMEWAEARGADVLSTSLGYLDWYTYEDMDGDTAVTTRAANVAAAKGLLVVTANGNEGDNPGYRWMVAPADGFKTLGVGAVNDAGVLADFSSRGPTFDGRIKPNVCARGVDTWCAKTGDPHGYFPSAGTSLATPLAAGAAALLVQARPDLSPDEIRMALMRTASRAGAPDNDYGYGLVRALDASRFDPGAVPPADKPRLRLSFPPAFSPNGDGRDDTLAVTLSATDDDGVEYWQLAITGAGGAADVRRLFFGSDAGETRLAWDGRDLAGRTLPPGEYRLLLSAWDRFANLASLDGGGVRLESRAKTLAGATVYPNPFAPARGHAFVRFAGLPAGTAVAVYDLAGEPVWRGETAAGGELSWDGTGPGGAAVAAGVYLYRLDAGAAGRRGGKLAVLR